MLFEKSDGKISVSGSAICLVLLLLSIGIGSSDAKENQQKTVQPVVVSKIHQETGSDCTVCHPDGSKKISKEACLGCHGSIFQSDGTGPVNHRFFTQSCDQCHKEHKGDRISTDVDVAVFNHSVTGYILEGKHLTAGCTECHPRWSFPGTPRDCTVCHWIRRQDDPYRTRLGTDCGRCHSPSGWIPAQWSHGIETGYTLTGGHAGRACDECHPGLRFAGTPADCYACHASDYNRTQDPDHKSAGFPIDCAMCHTTSTFNRSFFKHTWFPIDTGPHSQYDCSDCHPNRSRFSQFTCTSCHLESRTQTDHKDVPGYRYEDNACYGCHPTGRN